MHTNKLYCKKRLHQKEVFLQTLHYLASVHFIAENRTWRAINIFGVENGCRIKEVMLQISDC
jgi:hypothetical protein